MQIITLYGNQFIGLGLDHAHFQATLLRLGVYPFTGAHNPIPIYSNRAERANLIEALADHGKVGFTVLARVVLVQLERRSRLGFCSGRPLFHCITQPLPKVLPPARLSILPRSSSRRTSS